MRKRVGNFPKRNPDMLDLDSDDDDNSISSSSSTQSDRMSVTEMEDVQKDKLLDQVLDALYEKRGSMREKALSTIIEAFNSEMQNEFLEKKFATLLHQCIASVKKGSVKEVCLASHAIGLLAITVGCGDNAREIVEESFPVLAQALKSRGDSQKQSKLLECLAIITFVGANDPDETEKAMEIMWQLVLPKLGSNVVAVKPSPAVISAMVSAWSFLLTSMNGWSLDPKKWKDSISYFSSLLEKDDRSVRIAAGEAIALIFEMGSLEKFASDAGAVDGPNNDSDKTGGGIVHVHGLRAKVLNQVRNLSMEAAGKGSAKKDLNSQRNLFKDILEFLEDGSCPETSVKIGGDTLKTTTWSQLVQLNYFKHFLGGGFVKHMQVNSSSTSISVLCLNSAVPHSYRVFGLKNKRGNEMDGHSIPLLGMESIKGREQAFLRGWKGMTIPSPIPLHSFSNPQTKQPLSLQYQVNLNVGE